MKLILFIYDRLCWSMCRHEWVRERQNGKLWERCSQCMKRQPDRMTELVKLQVDYVKIEPAQISEMPPPLEPRRASRKAA